MYLWLVDNGEIKRRHQMIIILQLIPKYRRDCRTYIQSDDCRTY